MVASFYSHDAIWDKFQPAKEFTLSVSSYRVIELQGGIFTAMSVDSEKKIFNDKMKELNDTSSHRSPFLDNERYNKFLR